MASWSCITALARVGAVSIPPILIIAHVIVCKSIMYEKMYVIDL